MTASSRCWWVKLGECGELQYGRRFPLKLKGAVYKSYARSAILYRSETWCLNESEIGILGRTGRSMMRAMCEWHLKDRKGNKHLMLILGLNETMAVFVGMAMC